MTKLPLSWHRVLEGELQKPYFQALAQFVDDERRKFAVYPPEKDVFTAFKLTPYEAVNVVIVGQDPYHDEGQAHGLAFSVPPGVRPPPSLVNIFKELEDDLGVPPPAHGCLVDWAKQGVLLLNTVLTVRAHRPNSHRGQGWETFTDAVLHSLNSKSDRVVFVLFGASAQKKKTLIQRPRHAVVEASHPSPLSAHKGFFGSAPFSRINRELRDGGKSEIDWKLAPLG